MVCGALRPGRQKGNARPGLGSHAREQRHCYGFQGKPGGGAAYCTRSAIRAGQEGERRGYGIVIRITHGGIKGGLHLITTI